MLVDPPSDSSFTPVYLYIDIFTVLRTFRYLKKKKPFSNHL